VGIKWSGYEAEQSSPSSVKVKNKWCYTSMPPYAFMVCTVTTSSLLWVLQMHARIHTHTHRHTYTHQSCTELHIKLMERTVNTTSSNFYVIGSITQTRCEGVDWIHFIQDRDQLQVHVNTVTNSGVPQNAGGLWTK
jgi:hypothetical protein